MSRYRNDKVSKSIRIPRGLEKSVLDMKGEATFTDFTIAALAEKITKKHERDLVTISMIKAIRDTLDRIELKTDRIQDEVVLQRRWLMRMNIIYNIQHPNDEEESKKIKKEKLEKAMETTKKIITRFIEDYSYDNEIYKEIFNPEKDDY